MTLPQTLLDKLWSAHEVLLREDDMSLLWVDRHWVHEGSHHAFGKIAARDLPVKEPSLTFAVVDHYAPTMRNKPASGSIGRMIDTLQANAKAHDLKIFDLNDTDQGIVHVISPEQGITLPGLLINCGDSHTSTHGAFGALSFGVGATEVAHILATQTVWQAKPKSMRITINGELPPSVTAKDMALHWIAELGAGSARGYAIEYAGSAVRALSMEGRMTLCNLSIEGGARLGMIAPDEVTFDYLEGRPYSPTGSEWENAMRYWATLQSDYSAHFDKEVTIDAKDIAPTVTWGTSPDQALPITGVIPDPSRLEAKSSSAAEDALDYMGLSSGKPIAGTPIDRVFIGSCTNGRIEDLRSAASVLRGRKSKVPGMVSPGSTPIKVQAEMEGLDRIFIEAGLDWVASGCSMCVGMNGDLAKAGERCASSTNRNFPGRQGRGARTHLMAPAMVAAAAVTGTITDVRKLINEVTQ
jgi:3-isopropylmalate/(R)-2-methylmalate dehydratase large subunit